MTDEPLADRAVSTRVARIKDLLEEPAQNLPPIHITPGYATEISEVECAEIGILIVNARWS